MIVSWCAGIDSIECPDGARIGMLVVVEKIMLRKWSAHIVMVSIDIDQKRCRLIVFTQGIWMSIIVISKFRNPTSVLKDIHE